MNGTPNLLFINQGDGTFREEARAWRVDDRRWSYAAAFADVDEDGRQDLYVANDFGENALFMNRPVMICLHSFTAYQHGVLRPWHVGILWDQDPRVAVPLMTALREPGDIVVGDNQPYSGRHSADFTVDHHAETLGLAYGAMEIRQDLIEDESGQQRWADRLADVLEAVLRDERLFQPLAG